jgi:mannosyltransferase
MQDHPPQAALSTEPPASESVWSRYEWWLVGGVTLLAAILRIHHIATEPLWNDEALTLRFAQLPLADLVRDLAEIDVHPPLYYLLLKFWTTLGDSEFLLRLPSAICGTLTVPLLYAVGRAVGARGAGLAGALLLATSALHVQFSQEARSYALLTFATTLALWGLAGLFAAERPRIPAFGAALLRRSRSDDWRTELPWWAYVAGSALALHAHSLGVFLPAVASGVAALWWVTRGRFEARFLGSWLAANLLVLLIWSPWIPFVFTQTVDVLADTWMRSPSRSSAWRILARTWGPGFGGAPLLWALYALAAWGAWSWRRRPFAALLVAGVAAGVPLLMYVVSQWRPVFIERSLIWPNAAFLLLLGAGCIALRPRALAALALVGVLAVHAVSLGRYYAEERKEPWDEAAAYVDERLEPGDMVLFHPSDAEMAFRYYFRHSLAEVPMVGVVPDGPAWRRRVDQVEVVAADDLAGLLAEHPRIWLVRRHARVAGGDRLLEELERCGREVSNRRLLNLEIVLFERD